MNLDELIRKIIQHPGAFIGSAAITPLWHYLNGYRAGVYYSGNETEKTQLIPLDFRYFGEYVKFVTGAGNSATGWYSDILEICGGNEEKAFYRFVELYDAFRAVIAVSPVKICELSEENIAFCVSMKGVYKAVEGENIPVL